MPHLASRFFKGRAFAPVEQYPRRLSVSAQEREFRTASAASSSVYRGAAPDRPVGRWSVGIPHRTAHFRRVLTFFPK